MLATLATIQNHSVGKPSGQLGYPGLTFLIQRLSEVFEDAGGNSPCSSQFTLGNILAGALGGAGGALATGGGGILGSLLGMAANSGVDLGALAGQLVGGGLTGLIVQMVVGFVLNKLKS